MKDIRNLISAVLILLWAGLLAVLMVRMPVADLLAGLEILPVDTVLSAFFVAIGAASAVCGLCLRSKPLLVLSCIQAGFLLVFAIFVCLYLVTFNGDMIAFGLYFINPFAALLSCRFLLFFILSVLLVLLPAVCGLLLKLRERKERKAAQAES